MSNEIQPTVVFSQTWSVEDEEWIATCNVFKNLACGGSSPDKALAGLLE